MLYLDVSSGLNVVKSVLGPTDDLNLDDEIEKLKLLWGIKFRLGIVFRFIDSYYGIGLFQYGQRALPWNLISFGLTFSFNPDY